jgi:excisionase family DNA binding protein
MERVMKDLTSNKPAPVLDEIDTAAAYLRVHPRTVRNLIARGELTGYRISGTRSIRVDMNEVADLAKPIPTAGRAS